MNKAFVREPDADGRAYCPRCNTTGAPVGSTVLNNLVLPTLRNKLGDSAWFCPYARCDVAYFDEFETVIGVEELQRKIYPHDLDAPICSCFGLSYDDVQADAREPVPSRIRQLWTRSQSAEARCHEIAPDGQCCFAEVQRLYMKLKDQPR
ncbi:MAG: hypothetical protein R3E01_15205 [Pirellulaceae bacterium]|nr:hypothetical protein [Planctomycetales bacterium]